MFRSFVLYILVRKDVTILVGSVLDIIFLCLVIVTFVVATIAVANRKHTNGDYEIHYAHHHYINDNNTEG